MQREEGNDFLGYSYQWPLNTLQRIVPLTLTPLDVSMSRATYLWLYYLCCSYKIPMRIECVGARGITEPTMLKKFLELFNPIAWWKSTLEKNEKYVVLLNIQREYKVGEDGSVTITLIPNLEVPEPDYRYVCPLANPVECKKYFQKMCALNRVNESSDRLFQIHRQEVEQHQYIFLNKMFQDS